jgi:putative membrane-bound dehydrogenase-like protein
MIVPASRYCLAACVVLAVLNPRMANADRPKVPFLTPEKARAKMTLPDGFRVSTFAAEPDILQPFAFCFDDRGRLWVCENLNYETRGKDSHAQGPKGRIVILDDTDGDGRFDTKKLFADKIFFPSGLALGFGGVWVGSPPNLLFIPDRDRDDRPDGPPRVVLDGWGRHDRHETLNSFIWGPDGWLYGCHGVFTHSRVGKPGTPDDEREPINAGVWRYHPVKERFEIFAWGTSNPWGLDFDDHGQAFITACVIPHLWHIIQGGRFHRQAGKHFSPFVYDDIKTIADHRHKSAHGGARFYLADAFPKRYRGRLFMCNIHQHEILTDVLERRGSGFVGHHGDEFLKANDPQWLGFNMEVGPDGAVYVIDWHDQDICGNRVHHGETGRIWRVSYGDTKAKRGYDLAKLDDAALVALHLDSNDWNVRQARRILQERAATGKLSSGTYASLRKMLADHPETPRKLRALWSLHVTGGIDDAALVALLDDGDEYLRAWSIQLLAEDRAVPAAAKAKFPVMAREDDSALVRLYLASACQRMPIEDRWDTLAALAARAEDATDHNLPLMVWYALESAVPTDLKRALSVAKTAKLKSLARYITRRIATRSRKSKTVPKNVPKTVKPAASVSNDKLTLWLRPDFGVDVKDGRVAGWRDRSDDENDAAQSAAESRPKLVDSLGGRKALRFDGKDDHLVIDDCPELRFSADDDFSVSTWVYREAAQKGWRGIITKSRDSRPWYGIWIDPSGRWIFGGSAANRAGPRATNGWRHICVVQSQDVGRRIYVDGALVEAGEVADARGDGDLWIAGAKSTKEFFAGGIGEVRIYRRALGHPEVARLAAGL